MKPKKQTSKQVLVKRGAAPTQVVAVKTKVERKPTPKSLAAATVRRTNKRRTTKRILVQTFTKRGQHVDVSFRAPTERELAAALLALRK